MHRERKRDEGMSSAVFITVVIHYRFYWKLHSNTSLELHRRLLQEIGGVIKDATLCTKLHKFAHHSNLIPLDKHAVLANFKLPPESLLVFYNSSSGCASAARQINSLLTLPCSVSHVRVPTVKACTQILETV